MVFALITRSYIGQLCDGGSTKAPDCRFDCQTVPVHLDRLSQTAGQRVVLQFARCSLGQNCKQDQSNLSRWYAGRFQLTRSTSSIEDALVSSANEICWHSIEKSLCAPDTSVSIKVYCPRSA
jgi:hypothetical protein